MTAQKKAEVLASVELEGSINNVPFRFLKQFNQPSTTISNIDSSINKYNLPSNIKDQETNLTGAKAVSSICEKEKVMHADSQSVMPVQPESKTVIKDISSDATPPKVSKTAKQLHYPSPTPNFCTTLNLPIKLLSDSQSESPLSNCFLGEEENQQDNHYWRKLVQTPEISPSEAKSFTILRKFNHYQENAKLEK